MLRDASRRNWSPDRLVQADPPLHRVPRFDPWAGTVKRVSLLLCAALTAGAVVAAPTRPVAAQGVDYDGTCGKALPSEFIGAAGDWTHNVLTGDGALVPVEAGYAIAPGGSGLLAGSATAVAYGGASIATFLMAMEASCVVGDYVGFDGAVASTVTGTVDFVTGLFGRADPTVLGVGGINDYLPSEPVFCGAVTAPAGHTVDCSAAESSTDTRIEQVTGPSTVSASPIIGRFYQNNVGRTIGDVTLSHALEVDPWYQVTRSAGTLPYIAGKYTSGATLWKQQIGPLNSGTDYLLPRYLAVGYRGSHVGTGRGVGGVHGVPPGEYYYAADTGATPDHVFAFFHTYTSKLSAELGWQRVHTVDVRCWDGSSGTGGMVWRRVVSPPWWDASPTERVPVVRCADGDVPVQWIISQPPTGITLPTTGTVSKWTVEQVIAPDWWTSVDPSNDWTICLTADATCGTPATETVGETTTCVWGGYEVHSGACGPVVSPEVTPEIAPRTTGTQVVTTAPDPIEIGSTTDVVTTQPTTTTTDPPDEPGTGTDIVVPINPGTGMGNPTDGEGCIGGWSWFNPIEWVLEPVKCALLWAFVPDAGTLATAFDDFQTELFAQFPFSLIALAVDFLGTLGDEMSAASGSGCFSFGGSWSFGSAGSVDADDVCIGDDVTVTVAQRAVLLAIIGAPMVFGLLRHAWGMVLGGSKREAEA